MACLKILYVFSCICSTLSAVRLQQWNYRHVCPFPGDHNCGNYPLAGDHGDSPPVRWCGQAFVNGSSGRIINGEESKPHEFPWMAKLVVDNFFFCAGTLIANNYVLTAGHCVALHIKGTSELPKALRGPERNYEVTSPARMAVELGVYAFNDANPRIWSQVLKIFLHPYYDVFVSHEYMMQTNDVAVLRVQPIQFTQFVTPICLPQQGEEVPDGTLMTVAGWGLIQEESEDHLQRAMNPRSLMKTTLRKISWLECRNNPLSRPFLDPEYNLTNSHIICMLGSNTDACQGDSGGAVVQRTNQGYVIQGIVSWGIGCNQPNFPSAFTRVSSYMNFILSRTQGAHYLPRRPRGDNWLHG